MWDCWMEEVEGRGGVNDNIGELWLKRSINEPDLEKIDRK